MLKGKKFDAFALSVSTTSCLIFHLLNREIGDVLGIPNT